MAVMQQQATEQGFKFHFFRSTYVTIFTEWLLGFGGKSAHVILIFTMLYMSAELYPGVSLPPGLSIAVFLIQMFALDMGGMGLASLARQARADGNTEGADKAQNLSNWLIRIMIAGLITVCLEQAISRIPNTGGIQGYIDAGKLVVEIALVVARAICAVLYGATIHALKSEIHQAPPAITPAPAPLDYQELARQVAAFLPQQTAPALDYKAIAREIAPMFEATIVREIKAIATIAGPPTAPRLEAIASSHKTTGPVIEATNEGQGQGQKARATKRNTGPLVKATDQGQGDQQGQGQQDTDEDSAARLEAAYQQILSDGGRVSGRALAPLAKVNKGRAAQWLRAAHPEATGTQGQGQGQQDDEATDQGQE